MSRPEESAMQALESEVQSEMSRPEESAMQALESEVQSEMSRPEESAMQALESEVQQAECSSQSAGDASTSQSSQQRKSGATVETSGACSGSVPAVASADLRQELDCSICLSTYTDPVGMPCGHFFCRVCIDRVLDAQEGAGAYNCPTCRANFKKRPALIPNIPVCNIVGRFLSPRPDQDETDIFCTCCIHSPVPAAKSSLLCDASLCDKHLRVHSRSAEHVLPDPTTSPRNRKCSVHRRILEYYCTEDDACICASCNVAGEHQGHHVVMLDEASERKKEELRHVLHKLDTESAETEKRIQRLQERRREDREKATDIKVTTTALVRDIRRQLEDLEKRVLSEITRQEQRVSLATSDLIQQLEIKKEELSGKKRHIEELCNKSDPVTVLQEPDSGDLCDTGGRKRRHIQVHEGGDLDVGPISGTLQTLSDIITGINTGVYVEEAIDLSVDVATAGDTESDTMTDINTGVYVHESLILDVATACNKLEISRDRKTASWSDIHQSRPAIPGRFKPPQVISTRGFSSGRHYWEVDVSNSEYWRVGMCYPSISRKGRQSAIGSNKKSWCLSKWNNNYYVWQNDNDVQLPDNIPCDRLRIYLNYEAGQLSFYSLSRPIRHLHTVTATFTEPLHAALMLWRGTITFGRVAARCH